MITREEFLSIIEDFMAKRNMKPTNFGLQAFKDPSFVRRVKNGRNNTLPTVERAIRFIEGHSNDP